MAMKTAFVVQPFEIHRKRLRPARQEAAQTESGALKKAENLAKRMPGAAAMKVVADDETGKLEGVTILGQWGDVLEDFAESLQGGGTAYVDGGRATSPTIRRMSCVRWHVACRNERRTMTLHNQIGDVTLGPTAGIFCRTATVAASQMASKGEGL